MNKDIQLENSILTSTNNQRHCLYFIENNKNTVGKTLVSSNEAYQKDDLGVHRDSVIAHEQLHIISTSATYFKRSLLLKSINSLSRSYEFDSYPFDIHGDKNSSDFLFLYNSEIVPFLEAFALIYQCRLAATTNELKDNILSEVSIKNHTLFNIMVDLEDIFEKIKDKCVSNSDVSVELYFILSNLVFSTPDPINKRVFDRYRILRDMEKIPEWKDYKEIAMYLRDYLASNGYDSISLNLGSEKGIIEMAYFFNKIKTCVPDDRHVIQPYLFGILSELDPQLGRISYSVKNLKTLEGKRINHCYMGNLFEKNLLFETDRIILNNTDEVIRNKKYTEHLKVLKEYRKNMINFFVIKKEVFKHCLGPSKCRGREDCPLRKLFLNKASSIL